MRFLYLKDIIEQVEMKRKLSVYSENTKEYEQLSNYLTIQRKK